MKNECEDCLFSIKKVAYKRQPFRGPERIRTAVEGFADLCLAARPQDPFNWEHKSNTIF